jgi:hypothetical protein
VLRLSVGSLLLSSIAAGKGLVVAPARLELKLRPGETQAATLSVSNIDDRVQHFRLSVSGFSLTATGDVSFEPGRVSRFPPETWIGINPEEMDIPGGENASVRLRVTAPPDAAGTIWGGVLVAVPASGEARGGIGVTTEPRVFVPVYVTITGTEKPEAGIDSFQAVRDGEGVFHFRASLRNRGNTLLRPSGSWLLEEATARGPVELAAVPFSGEPVLPGQVRKFEGEARGKVTATNFVASVFFDYGTRKGQVISATGPVEPAEAAPERETRSVASAVIPDRRKDEPTASRRVRVAIEPRSIRLDAGEPIPYRSEVVLSPPGLLLDLVGYRVASSPAPRGHGIVERLIVREVQKRPVITRLEVRFRIPVTVQILEDPRGLRIQLEPGAGASPPAPAAPTPAGS